MAPKVPRKTKQKKPAAPEAVPTPQGTPIKSELLECDMEKLGNWQQTVRQHFSIITTEYQTFQHRKNEWRQDLRFYNQRQTYPYFNPTKLSELFLSIQFGIQQCIGQIVKQVKLKEDTCSDEFNTANFPATREAKVIDMFYQFVMAPFIDRELPKDIDDSQILSVDGANQQARRNQMVPLRAILIMRFYDLRTVRFDPALYNYIDEQIFCYLVSKLGDDQFDEVKAGKTKTDEEKAAHNKNIQQDSCEYNSKLTGAFQLYLLKLNDHLLFFAKYLEYINQLVVTNYSDKKSERPPLFGRKSIILR